SGLLAASGVLVTVLVPVTVPRFSYCPAVAVPVAVNTHCSPGSSRLLLLASPMLWDEFPCPEAPSPSVRVIAGLGPSLWRSSAGLPGVPLSSVSTTLAIGSLPGLLTLYVQVTAEPTGTSGPVGLSLSVPLVSLTRAMRGLLAVGTALTWLEKLIMLPAVRV